MCKFNQNAGNADKYISLFIKDHWDSNLISDIKASNSSIIPILRVSYPANADGETFGAAHTFLHLAVICPLPTLNLRRCYLKYTIIGSVGILLLRLISQSSEHPKTNMVWPVCITCLCWNNTEKKTIPWEFWSQTFAGTHWMNLTVASDTILHVLFQIMTMYTWFSAPKMIIYQYILYFSGSQI